MKKIALFSIPAHGHTNPMIPVAAELVRRGNSVRFYSFNEFKEKIESSKAEFVACDEFLPELTQKEFSNLMKVSTTEMTVTDIKTTMKMDSFLQKEFDSFKPDVVYSDSVCFWGKLNAWKHNVPLVVSQSTIAFNQLSSTYMKNSPAEICDMIFGLSKIKKALVELEEYGYVVKNPLKLVMNDNNTDTVVYTSKNFQPFDKSFSQHYAFVGPSLPSDKMPDKKTDRPLVYISMGTVINDRPDLYKNCIEALKDADCDLIISCGRTLYISTLGELPENVSVYPYVDQLDVLSKASVFITHCGMNSVSESLFMATPMVLFPQTGEQKAVARRVSEIGAGTYLKNESVEEIRKTVKAILSDKSYAESAENCSRDFRSCSGTVGAAEFIENAPHTSTEEPLLDRINKFGVIFQIVYQLLLIAFIVLMCFTPLRRFAWVIGVLVGVLSTPISKAMQKLFYKKLTKK